MNDKSVGDIEYTLKNIWSAEVFDMDNNAVVKTCIMSKKTWHGVAFIVRFQ